MKLLQKKICLLGDFAVGKTSLVRRYVEGRFDEKYLSTIGVSISRKSVAWRDRKINLLFWDLAGGEKFADYQSSYLRGAAGALIVCDVTREETLIGLSLCVKDFFSANPSAAIVFLGNKIDLLKDNKASQVDLANVANDFASPYYYTSAKTGQAVQEAILSLVEMLMGRHE